MGTSINLFAPVFKRGGQAIWNVAEVPSHLPSGGDVKLSWPGLETVISKSAFMDITYNFFRLFNFRSIHGRKAKDVLPKLEAKLAEFGSERSADYWAVTPGNVGYVINILVGWAKVHPEGYFWVGGADTLSSFYDETGIQPPSRRLRHRATRAWRREQKEEKRKRKLPKDPTFIVVREDSSEEGRLEFVPSFEKTREEVRFYMGLYGKTHYMVVADDLCPYWTGSYDTTTYREAYSRGWLYVVDDNVDGDSHGLHGHMYYSDL